MARSNVDPVTIEVFSNALQSIAEEMGVTLIRTSYSVNIKERQDASCAIFDSEGRLIAQAEHIPLHLGAMLSMANEIVKRYKPSELNDGDMFLANDPYNGGGTHLADVTLAAPVIEKGELLGFVANMGHWPDVGGRSPGAAASEGSTEIYQEGLRIPPIRLVEAGKMQEDVRELIFSNIRLSGDRTFDLKAQIGCNKLGINRMRELYGRYGIRKAKEIVAAMLDYTESRIRAEIRKIPEGTYKGEDYLDDDGHSDEPVTLKVAVTVRHRPKPEIEFDFTGSSPQRVGAVNVVLPAVLASINYVLRAITDPTVASNAGYYRAIKIVSPKGCVLNPEPPAATGGRGTTCQRLVDAILRALSYAIPDRVVAASHGTTSMNFSGFDNLKGRRWVCIDGIGGGLGGSAIKDGLDGVQVHTNNIPNTPVEVTESEWPMRVLRYEFVSDSGGMGKHRGGLAIVKEILFLSDTNYIPHSDRYKIAPWGLFGGLPGQCAFAYLNRGTKREQKLPSKAAGISIRAGDVLEIQSAGGGGYGDPYERSIEDVENDLRMGKATPKSAELCGVVVNARGLVDREETIRLRRRHTAGRK